MRVKILVLLWVLYYTAFFVFPFLLRENTEKTVITEVTCLKKKHQKSSTLSKWQISSSI